MKARTHSKNGCEGLILRGIGRKKIFLCEDDRRRFLSAVFRFAQKMQISVVAYCLRENHARIQVSAKEPAFVGEFVKKVCISYVQHYFNPKYSRCGSLFQSRYISFFEEEALPLEKQVNAYPLYEKDALSQKYSSFNETVEFLSGVCETKLCGKYFSERYTINSFIKSVGEKVRYYLPILAYTPTDEEVAGYLKENGYRRNRSCDLFQLIKNLRKNHVSFKRIGYLMGLGTASIKRIYLNRLSAV